MTTSNELRLDAVVRTLPTCEEPEDEDMLADGAESGIVSSLDTKPVGPNCTIPAVVALVSVSC